MRALVSGDLNTDLSTRDEARPRPGLAQGMVRLADRAASEVRKHGPESNARASQRARSKPRGAMKVKGGARRPRWDPGTSARRAHHRPASPTPSGRWSRSARDRTRKMVNILWGQNHYVERRPRNAGISAFKPVGGCLKAGSRGRPARLVPPRCQRRKVPKSKRCPGPRGAAWAGTPRL